MYCNLHFVRSRERLTKLAGKRFVRKNLCFICFHALKEYLVNQLGRKEEVSCFMCLVCSTERRILIIQVGANEM
jgi:predicted ATP-dependent Lon-type protease